MELIRMSARALQHAGRPAGGAGGEGRARAQRRALHLGVCFGEFNMTAMSRLYRRKFSNGDDDAVVAIFSPPGVRRVGLPYYRSAAGGQ
jgi:hypothetical protein